MIYIYTYIHAQLKMIRNKFYIILYYAKLNKVLERLVHISSKLCAIKKLHNGPFVTCKGR